jgi:DME family drug/metabolite transporter
LSNLLSSLQKRIGAGEVWAFSGALAYSFDNVFTAFAVRGQGINFYLGACLRSLPVFTFTIIVTLFSRKRTKNSTSPFSNIRIVLALIAYGLLTFFLGNTMFFSALQKGGVLVTTPLAGTQVLWAALFAILLLGEGLNWKMVAGMLISIVGIFILAIGRSGGVNLAPQWWLAIPLALGTAVCWSLSGVLIAYAQRKGVDRFHALLFALVVGYISLNGYMLFSGQISSYTTTPLKLMGNVIMAGGFNMLALISITTALGLTSVASATTLGSLQVGLAPIFAWLLIKEEMNLLIGIGIVLILTGVIVVQINRSLDNKSKNLPKKELLAMEEVKVE